LITYKIMNIKWNKQGYGAKSYLKLMLNKLKVMRVFYFYLYPLRDLWWKKPSLRLSCAHRSMNLKIFINIKELWVNCEWTSLNPVPNARVCVYLTVHITKLQLQTTSPKPLYIPHSTCIHWDPGHWKSWCLHCLWLVR